MCGIISEETSELYNREEYVIRKLYFYNYLILIFFLNACGGGGADSGSSVTSLQPMAGNNANDNDLPIIAGPTETIKTNEGSTAVVTVSAMDPNHDVPLTYKLEGNSTSATDYSSFDISSTGVITYKTAPIYVTKNSYSITTVVSDQYDSVKKDINITVNIPAFEWKTSTPAVEGMNATKLQVALDYAFTDIYNTQGLIIIKNGKIVSEQYQGISDDSVTGLKRIFGINEGWATDWDDAKYESELGTRALSSKGTSNSSAKTILGSLIGIAIDNGSINSVDDKVSQYITSWVGTVKENITLKDMITMRAGLTAIPETKGLLGSHTLMYESDGLAVALARGLNPDPPANKWRYDGMGDPLILAEVLRIATGKDAKQYGEDNLFSKMGITDYDWWKDEAGTVLTWATFDSTLRDFAKFALLWSKDTGLDAVYGENVIGDGKWNGEQLISSSWLTDAKKAAVVTTFADYIFYGYLMYQQTKLIDLDAEELAVTVYAAKGASDNSIWWMPAYDLIVVRHGLYLPVVNIGNEKIMQGDISGDPPSNKDNANYLVSLFNGSVENTSAGYRTYNANFSWSSMNDEHMLKKIIESIN